MEKGIGVPGGDGGLSEGRRGRRQAAAALLVRGRTPGSDTGTGNMLNRDRPRTRVEELSEQERDEQGPVREHGPHRGVGAGAL